MAREIPFRKQLGFSQEIYAQYLRVSKSTVSLVELGKRSLNAAATKRHYDLYFRWLRFEQSWMPIPSAMHSVEEVNEAKKCLEEEIFCLRNERDRHIIDNRPSRRYIPDYPKINAFLLQEMNSTSDPLEQATLRVVLSENQVRMMRQPLLETLKKSLALRFLNFKIAELEKCLEDLG